MRQTRKYSLFKRNGNRWIRDSSNVYTLDVARRVFQSRLLDHALNGGPERSLRPVKTDALVLFETAAPKPRLVK